MRASSDVYSHTTAKRGPYGIRKNPVTTWFNSDKEVNDLSIVS